MKPTPKTRIKLKEIYISTAEMWAARSTCLRASVGGILVLDGRIVASGFNGSPTRLPHCFDEGCLIQVRDGRECCLRALHCEAAIISFCSKHSISTDGCDLWITLFPCYDCAKLLINAGIKNIFYREKYSGFDGLDILKESGIVVKNWLNI